MAHQHVASNPSTPAVAVVNVQMGQEVPYATFMIWQILTQFMRAQISPIALAELGCHPVEFPASLPDGSTYEGKVELVDGVIKVSTRPSEGGTFDNRPLWQAHQARQWFDSLGPWDKATLSR